MASRECILKSLLVLQTVIDFDLMPRVDDPELGTIPGTVDVWVNDLVEFSDEQVTLAFIHFRRNLTSEFNRKPRPGDVAQFIERVQTGGWEAGWAEYLARARMPKDRVGQDFAWSSELVQVAVTACGGVSALRAADESRHVFFQKAFREAYEAEADCRRTNASLAAAGRPLLPRPVPAIAQMGPVRARRAEAEAARRAGYTEDDARADIERLRELRRQQLGDGPLLVRENLPVVDRSQPTMPSLGTYIQRLRNSPPNQEVGRMVDGLAQWEAQG